VRAMRLAEGMAACDERNGFIVFHGHVAESQANIGSGGDWVRLAVRSFRVDVDQTHLGGGEGTFQAAFSVTPLIREPFFFRPPEDESRFPGIDTTPGKPESLEAHVLKRDVAGE